MAVFAEKTFAVHGNRFRTCLPPPALASRPAAPVRVTGAGQVPPLHTALGSGLSGSMPSVTAAALSLAGSARNTSVSAV